MNTGRWDANQAGERLEEHVAELHLLQPALRTALEHDHSPIPGNRVTTGGISLTLPVNADVYRALEEIPYGYLHAYPADFQQAVSTGDLPAAKRISRDVDHWRRLAKRALGLLHYDRPLGQPCPQHDDPLTELVALGDEGWLIHDRDGFYVRWQKDQRVWCRHCGSIWDTRQMLLLGRLLKWAEKRRTQQAYDRGGSAEVESVADGD